MDVEILSGKVSAKQVSQVSYYWSGPYREERELIFQNAFMIEGNDWGEGVGPCTYRVYDRVLQRLACMKGETLRVLSDSCELRRHEDGTKFLFVYREIPTFDSGDRDWDSMEHIAVYQDAHGVHMIQCRHGYLIPRINVYLALQKSVPMFSELLRALD